MRLSPSNRAAIVVFFTWLITVAFAQVMRSGTIAPPSMTATAYWGLMGFIALLLAVLAKVITSLVLLLVSTSKRPK